MRLSLSTLVLISSILAISQSLPLDTPLPRRKATYSVVPVDGGPTAQNPAETTIVQTKETTQVTTEPAKTLPPVTTTIVSTLVQSASDNPVTIEVTLTSAGPAPTDTIEVTATSVEETTSEAVIPVIAPTAVPEPVSYSTAESENTSSSFPSSTGEPSTPTGASYTQSSSSFPSSAAASSDVMQTVTATPTYLLPPASDSTTVTSVSTSISTTSTATITTVPSSSSASSSSSSVEYYDNGMWHTSYRKWTPDPTPTPTPTPEAVAAPGNGTWIPPKLR